MIDLKRADRIIRMLIVASRNLLKADKRTNASRGLPIASRLATSSRLLLLCGPSHWDMWWCSGPSRTSGACLTIGSELETAREIQLSILPSEVPSVSNLRIAAACHARSAVAGDFYQFIPVDPHRLGVLVADVSGHGVPAALISSMLKVAMQSVAANADDPSQVL
jgi:serine phosphatase RsbU (regulator of sigma subunit)